MPIYMQFNEVKGSVNARGWERAGASAGVWKTTNFLTSDPNRPIAVSRISLTVGGGVDARDVLLTRKAAELFESARRSAPTGKLYVATDVGVFAKDPITGHTRLIFGSDQGVWSRPGIGILKSSDGGRSWDSSARPSGPGVYKTTSGGRMWSSSARLVTREVLKLSPMNSGENRVPLVEIFVSDRGNANGTLFRLKNVRIARGPRGTLELNYSSLEI